MRPTTCVRTAVAVVAAAALVSPLAGCGGQQSSAQPSSGGPVTLTFSSPVRGALPFLPVEVAIEKGYFAKHGVDLVQKTTSAAALPAALSSGQVTISADVVYDAGRFLENGIGVSFVAGLNDNVDFNLVAAPSGGVAEPGAGPDGWKTSFASLKGKTIGVAAKAGPIGLTVIELMKEAGVPSGQYTLLDTPGPVAASALKAKQVAAVFTGGGFDAPLLENKLGTQVLNVAKDIPAFSKQSNAAVFMTNKTLEQNAGVAVKVQAAIADADTFINDPKNIDEVVALARKTGTPDTSLLQSRVKEYSYSADLSLPGLTAAFDWARLAGITTKQIDVKSTVAPGVKTR